MEHIPYTFRTYYRDHIMFIIAVKLFAMFIERLLAIVLKLIELLLFVM
jgi:hypothetical protein